MSTQPSPPIPSHCSGGPYRPIVPAFAQGEAVTPTADTARSQRSDIRLALLARALRGFGDGFAIIILPVYLTAIGLSLPQIGIVAAVSSFGSAMVSLLVGFIAPRFALRDLLLAGAVAAALTGLAFPNVEHIAIILVVAFIGTVNTSTDAGMMVPLEHALLTRETPAQDRTKIFARYSLIGTLAAAAGALAAALPDMLASAGWEPLTAIRTMFYLYAALGGAAALLYRALSREADAAEAAPHAPLGPSRAIVVKLAALFSLDSFAGGFAVQSLMALWLFEQFELSLASASLFFFWSNILSAFSFPVAAWIAKRAGLINTMVFTHIPSSVCLILAALSPNLSIVLGLLLVRAALSQMDVPTRSSYVMAVVTPPERAAAASVTMVSKNIASSVSPAFAGFLLASAVPGLPLVLCGALKISYDLALLAMFRATKPPEETS